MDHQKLGVRLNVKNETNKSIRNKKQINNIKTLLTTNHKNNYNLCDLFIDNHMVRLKFSQL